MHQTAFRSAPECIRLHYKRIRMHQTALKAHQNASDRIKKRIRRHQNASDRIKSASDRIKSASRLGSLYLTRRRRQHRRRVRRLTDYKKDNGTAGSIKLKIIQVRKAIRKSYEELKYGRRMIEDAYRPLVEPLKSAVYDMKKETTGGTNRNLTTQYMAKIKPKLCF